MRKNVELGKFGEQILNFSEIFRKNKEISTTIHFSAFPEISEVFIFPEISQPYMNSLSFLKKQRIAVKYLFHKTKHT